MHLKWIEERSGKHLQADEHYGAAISTLETLHMPDRLRDCHMEYAQLLEERGDVRGAGQHWRSAAEIGKAAAVYSAAEPATTSNEIQQAMPNSR